MTPTSQFKISHHGGSLKIDLSSAAFSQPRGLNIPVDETLRRIARQLKSQVKGLALLPTLGMDKSGQLMAMKLWQRLSAQAHENQYDYELQLGGGPSAPTLQGSANMAAWFTQSLSWLSVLALSPQGEARHG